MNIPKRKFTIANAPGLTKARGGRPADVDPYIFASVGLTRSQWEYLSLWFPSGNISQAMRFLLERAQKFWPSGPFVFGHARKSGNSGGEL